MPAGMACHWIARQPDCPVVAWGRKARVCCDRWPSSWAARPSSTVDMTPFIGRPTWIPCGRGGLSWLSRCGCQSQMASGIPGGARAEAGRVHRREGRGGRGSSELGIKDLTGSSPWATSIRTARGGEGLASSGLSGSTRVLNPFHPSHLPFGPGDKGQTRRRATCHGPRHGIVVLLVHDCRCVPYASHRRPSRRSTADAMMAGRCRRMPVPSGGRRAVGRDPCAAVANAPPRPADAL